jgi:threonylcarbamoyladenosine tRNA methylthiotransferase MtaB
VVNTCTVTENGDADTRRLVNRISRENPGARIALVGCQAQILKEQLLKLPNVHWVVGNAQKMQLASLLDEPGVKVEKIRREAFVVEHSGIDRRHTRVNLKIQDGCDFYCSFCVIPFARGPARSRVFGDILREARELAAAGHKEVVLTGVNIGTYLDSGKTFLDVTQALEDIEGLERIRISSIEPTTIPKTLIERMRTSKKLCAYLHIPLQSGSEAILAAMSRKYSLAEFDAFVRFARDSAPDMCIGSDVIVGFPGETDALFGQTADYLRDSPIDYFHVFSYSERKFARSKKLAHKVSPEKIASRSQILRELGQRKRAVFASRFLGRTMDVLFEQKKNGFWIGTTENFLKVRVCADANLANRILPVAIERAEAGEAFGRLAA